MQLVLDNGKVRAEWQVANGALVAGPVTDKSTGQVLTPNPAHLALSIGDRRIDLSALRLMDNPQSCTVRGSSSAVRISDRSSKSVVSARLLHEESGLSVDWSACLPEDARYLRQTYRLEAGKSHIDVTCLELVRLRSDAAVAGSVKGSPLLAGTAYVAMEHPMAETAVEDGVGYARLPIRLPLKPDAPIRVSSVVGFGDLGKVRLSFCDYLESERPRPYEPVLHYNSWYDLGFFTPYDEAAVLSVVNEYGRELVLERGVRMHSFLLDDGWDDPRTLWGFHEGFPHGLRRVGEAVHELGASLGIWLSPWGGYGTPKERRLEFGRAEGFETNKYGFALSGPTYFRRFLEACERFVQQDGVRHFKFDGTGDTGSVARGSRFASDFDAAIELIGALRTICPDLYVNLTTGTWASPFWLLHADSVWRGGEDFGFFGPGTRRQQWITYRDALTYENVVCAGAFFPLNSLMLHGVTFAPQAPGLADDPGNDLPAEIWTLFASGTQCQELYVSPSLMTPERWDTLAAAARWARERCDLLRSSKWVGGDPRELEPYGWTSCRGRSQVLCVRNPKDLACQFSFCSAAAWPGSEGTHRWRPVWSSEGKQEILEAPATGEIGLTLRPFEVIVLETATDERS